MYTFYVYIIAKLKYKGTNWKNIHNYIKAKQICKIP